MEKYITQLLADIDHAAENISWPFADPEVDLHDWMKPSICFHTSCEVRFGMGIKRSSSSSISRTGFSFFSNSPIIIGLQRNIAFPSGASILHLIIIVIHSHFDVPQQFITERKPFLLALHKAPPAIEGAGTFYFSKDWIFITFILYLFR